MSTVAIKNTMVMNNKFHLFFLLIMLFLKTCFFQCHQSNHQLVPTHLHPSFQLHGLEVPYSCLVHFLMLILSSILYKNRPMRKSQF